MGAATCFHPDEARQQRRQVERQVRSRERRRTTTAPARQSRRRETQSCPSRYQECESLCDSPIAPILGENEGPTISLVVAAPARRALGRSMTERGLSERRALAVIGMSASALRCEPVLDRNVTLRARIVALAQRHAANGVDTI